MVMVICEVGVRNLIFVLGIVWLGVYFWVSFGNVGVFVDL